MIQSVLSRDADKLDIRKLAARAAEVFLKPHPEYDWGEIISGVYVVTNGTKKRMWAIDTNTADARHFNRRG